MINGYLYAEKLMTGKFITFEGGEGVGKSTQVKYIMQYLADSGQDAILVRQPGGTPISEKIREILLSPECAEMTPECEAYLYAAARAQLVQQVIIPALKEGKIVVCDRHIDSSLAYQGAGRGLGVDEVADINKYAIKDCPVDATVFIDLPHDKMFRSRQKSEALNDRFEVETNEFHKRVYEGFRKAAEMYPDRFIVIEPCQEKADTSAKIIAALRDKGVIK